MLADQIRHIDIALMILFFIVSVISVAVFITGFNNLRARRSFLYLEIKNADCLVHVCIMAFPTATRQYGILLPSEGIRLSLDNYYIFGTLTINTLEWQITNSFTEQSVKAPSHVRIGPHKVTTLTKIMAAEFVTTLFVVHTHEYVFHEPQSSAALSPSVTDAIHFV